MLCWISLRNFVLSKVYVYYLTWSAETPKTNCTAHCSSVISHSTSFFNVHIIVSWTCDLYCSCRMYGSSWRNVTRYLSPQTDRQTDVQTSVKRPTDKPFIHRVWSRFQIPRPCCNCVSQRCRYFVNSKLAIK